MIAARGGHQIHHILGRIDARESDVAARIRIGVSRQEPLIRFARILEDLRIIDSACDQYAIQGELFSRVIREGGEVPVTIEDAIRNMAVIEAVFRSAETGRWENP